MRAIVAVTIAALSIAFAIVQLASYSLTARAAASGALPTRVPASFGLTVYRALDRVAPAPYVESMLATTALADGDAAAAQRYALRLPASPGRNELLGRIALVRSQPHLAFEYFLAAPDIAELDRTIDARAISDPLAAYELEGLLERRLALLATHPDDVAEAYFRMGELANEVAWRRERGPRAQRVWRERAMRDFSAAVDLAPLSEKYLLNAANQAAMLDDLSRARALFLRAVDVDPASADALAGLGVVAFDGGDYATAREYLRRSGAIDPNAAMVRALRGDLASTK